MKYNYAKKCATMKKARQLTVLFLSLALLAALTAPAWADASEPTVHVKDASWDAGRTLFLVRTSTPYILVENTDVTMGEHGILVQLYDNDDTDGIATNVRIIGSDGAKYYPDRDSVPQLEAADDTAVAGVYEGSIVVMP